MKIFRTRTSLWPLWFWLLWLTTPVHADKTKMTPEEESAYFGKHLKPIPDETWKTIAGEKMTEKYTITKGDTLSDISKRLFGDSKYWPKVWAINNNSITNPHRIKPGVLIAFTPGTGSSLPSISLNDQVVTDANSMIPRSPRSEEWRNLPLQSWEHFQIAKPANIDTLGFDKNIKMSFAQKNKGFQPSSIPATTKLKYLGQIIGSRSEGSYLGMYDTVYIRADSTLQIGETYALTSEPNLLKSKNSDRVGYAYPILGSVKILGVRDGLFIGSVVTTRDFLSRGSSLIPSPPILKDLAPIPGPSSLQGILVFDHFHSTYTTAQFKEVYVDRGSTDGVKPGMIFRVFEHFDPSNDKKITSSDFIIDADVMVTLVSETFSSGIVISSRSLVFEHSTAVLLTDISDLLKNPGYSNQIIHKVPSDDLDKLDTGDALGKDDGRTLKQLEHWKGNPDTAPPPTAEDDGSAPPPPPPAATSDAAPPPSNSPTAGPESPENKEMTPPPAESKSDLPPPPDSPGDDAPPPPPPAATSDAAPPPPPPAATSDAAPPPPPPAATSDAAPPPPPAASSSSAPPPASPPASAQEPPLKDSEPPETSNDVIPPPPPN